ncbi:MAG: hypothetical protein ACTHXA_08590 [Gulosibacter sp.]|uniref:hypothetical protein n=1 Tax=Gulosibacter sp. TaxID=2817531 RepID=UPI003F9201CC
MTETTYDLLPSLGPWNTSYEHVKAAYRIMATEARYRPAAPGDGMGGVLTPSTTENIETEAHKYATQWVAYEEGPDKDAPMSHVSVVGYPNIKDTPALVFAIEAARSICAGEMRLAHRLLELATDETAHAAAKGMHR